jgi:hypothetical protein
MERKVYVLMWHKERRMLDPRAGAMFATSTIKRSALRHARRLGAEVYAIPYPGQGWDCPTIRAIFAPIADYRGRS